MPNNGLAPGPSMDEWLSQSHMGLNFGLGTAFRNPMSPNRNQRLETRPSGIANESGRDKFVPRYYGIGHKIYPYHAAQPYTLNYGNDIRLHCAFILGFGPLGITNLKIGNKPIADFGADIEYEIRTGNPGDSPLTLFTQDVNEDQPNAELPFGTYIQSKTGLCNQIQIDVLWPRGLYNLSTLIRPDGTQIVVSSARQMGVYVLIQRKDNGSVVYNASTVFNENIQGPFVRTISIPSLALTEYNVTVQRAQAPGDQSSAVDAVQCISVKGIKYGSPIKPMPAPGGGNLGIAYVAMRVKGSAKTQGVLDAFNCEVSSLLQSYNGTSWVEVKSNAPADIVADLLCGTVNPRPIARSRLNGPAFKAWKDKTQAIGFSFNDEIGNGELIEDAIQDVAFAGRGLYIPCDASGLHSARFEEENPNIDDIVTPLNSRGFKLQKTWGDIPQAIKAQWISRANDYLQEETIVPRTGYTEANATTFESMTFRGVNNHPQVVKLARYHWACALLRPTTYEFEMTAEYRLLQVGSRIKFTNDMISYGLNEARVESLLLDGSGNLNGFTVSEPFEMVTTKQYGVRVRYNDGTYIYKEINAVNGSTQTIMFKTAIPNGQPMPAVGDLCQQSYLNQEADLIVSAIIPGPDLTAVIQCLDYSPAVYSADTATPLPAYTPPISIPERSPAYVPPVPRIKGILSDENVMLQYGTSLIPRIKISYEVPATDRVQYVNYTYKRDDETEFPPPKVVHGRSGDIYINDVREGVKYQIQLQSVADNNYTSDWIATEETVVGRSTPPPDVEALFPQGDDMGIIAKQFVDFSHYTVKASNGIGGTFESADMLIPRLLAQSFPISIIPKGVVTLFVKAVDTAGNASVNAYKLTHDFGSINELNVVATAGDEQGISYADWEQAFIQTISYGLSFAAVVDGYQYLFPLTLLAKFWTGNPTAPFWQGIPTAPFWTGGRTIYQDFGIGFNVVPPDDITQPFIFKAQAIRVTAKQYFLQFKHFGEKPFWTGQPGAPFWTGIPTAPFWEPESEDQWRPFSGERRGERRMYKVRVLIPKNQVDSTSRIGGIRTIFDMPDVEDSFRDLVVGPSGTAIPLSKTFRQVKDVFPVIQVDGAYPDVATVKILDPLPYDVSGNTGPRIQVFDSTNTPTTGKVVGRVKGW